MQRSLAYILYYCIQSASWLLLIDCLQLKLLKLGRSE